MAFAVWSNAADTAGEARWVGEAVGLEQEWGMFAPSPPRDDGWFVTVARVANGSRFDAFRRAPLQWSKPADVFGSYGHERWLALLYNVWVGVTDAEGETNEESLELLLADFSRMLCARAPPAGAEWAREDAADAAFVAALPLYGFDVDAALAQRKPSPPPSTPSDAPPRIESLHINFIREATQPPPRAPLLDRWSLWYFNCTAGEGAVLLDGVPEGVELD